MICSTVRRLLAILDLLLAAQAYDEPGAGSRGSGQPRQGRRELLRVILIYLRQASRGGNTGENDEDSDRHVFLLSQCFAWSRFEGPVDGMKRKYWK